MGTGLRASNTAVVCLVYEALEVVRPALTRLIETAGNADIFVVENRSGRTEGELRPFVSGLLSQGRIAGYFLFDDNITNNAVEVALDSGVIAFDAYDHVVLTDGDLLPADDWLGAHQRLLDEHPELFSVSTPISYDNLDGDDAAAPDRHAPIAARATYDVFRSGVHLTTFRSRDFQAFLAWRRRCRSHVHDRIIEFFGNQVLGKVSGRSRIPPARHLTWDYMATEQGRAYAEHKAADPRVLFMHDRYCDFWWFTAGKAERFSGAWPRRPHAQIAWREVEIWNDATEIAAITFERIWEDGAVDPTAVSTVSVGERARRPLLHLGLAAGRLRVLVSAGPDMSAPVRARIDLGLSELEQMNWSLRLSDYLGPAIREGLTATSRP